MARFRRLALVVFVFAALLPLLSAQQIALPSESSDELQPSFSQVIDQVHRAESAGATPQEVAALVMLLNKALQMNEEALKLNGPEDAQKRVQLLTQVDEMLSSILTKASQLEAIAAQRTLVNRVLTYISGGIAALLATIVYVICTSLWRTYRIKRTFQMKIRPK